MKKQISITVEEDILAKAEEVAEKSKSSVSQVIEWTLKSLNKNTETKIQALKEGLSPEVLTERNRIELMTAINNVITSAIAGPPYPSTETVAKLNEAKDKFIRDFWNRLE